MRTFIFSCLVASLAATSSSVSAASQPWQHIIRQDVQQHLLPIFKDLHQHPELSFQETRTAAKLADELAAVGFTVHRGIGKTGVVAMLDNGDGPLVMMRADMDALPVIEKSGVSYASKVMTKDASGQMVGVMHACGHDMHVTSLIGTARYMAAHRQQWRGRLMLIGQPAEETSGGAQGMRKANIYQTFGTPDYALALHVSSELPSGRIWIDEGSPYSGVDSVDITVRGVGAHGASPHRGKDPVVIGAQIVLALQTIVSREIAPRTPAVITVGSFHAGTKHNIISDEAHLQLTVRSESRAVRDQLISAIQRVAKHTALAAGLDESLAPIVHVDAEPTPPVVNDKPLAQRLKRTIASAMGEDSLVELERLGMGAEDFGFFTMDPQIPSVYFKVGGTPAEAFANEKAGGPAVPSHHSPYFVIEPEPAIQAGVEATVAMLQELMPAN